MIYFVAAAILGMQGKVIWNDEGIAVLPTYIRAPQFRNEFPRSTIQGDDPLIFIQAINCLAPLGEKRALELILKAERESPGTDALEIIRVLFVGKKKGYSFPLIGSGQMLEYRPESAASWPAYPRIIVDGIPFYLPPQVSPGFGGGGYQGTEEDKSVFAKYVEENRRDWKFSPVPLVPPNDPFPLIEKLKTPGTTPERDRWTRDRLIEQIFLLIRTAYRPAKAWMPREARSDAMLLEKLHKEFLSQVCRWNRKLNIYVRKDGSFDQDELSYISPRAYQFIKLPGLQVTVNFRFEERDILSYSVDCKEDGDQPLSTAVVSVNDPKTGKELDWQPANSPSFVLTGDTNKEQRLAEPQHYPSKFIMRTSATAPLKMETPMELKLYYKGKVFKSSIITP